MAVLLIATALLAAAVTTRRLSTDDRAWLLATVCPVLCLYAVCTWLYWL